MSELKEMQRTLAVASVSTALLSFSLWVLSQRQKISSSPRVAKRFAVTENNAWLDQASYNVVTAICDAFFPSLETSDLTLDKLFTATDAIDPGLRKHCIKIDQSTIKEHRDYLLRGALDINLHWVVADAIGKLVTKEERFQVALMLKVLSTSAGCYMVTGYPVAFQDMPLAYRVKAMEGLRDCSLAPLRVFYQTFKRVVGNLFYSYIAEHGAANPNWKELNYHPEETVGKGKARTAEEERKAQEIDRLLRDKVSYPSVYNNLTAGKFVAVPTSADADTTDVLECDVVVVGSGSGGGMLAAQLAKAGFNVLVLEKGGYFRAEEFKSWRESEAFLHAFEKGGLCSTVEGNVLVLAGSCVGGGSTINWSASLRTPSVVQEDWANQGMNQFRQGGKFDEALDAVHGLLSVNCDNTHRTPAEQAALQNYTHTDNHGHCGGSSPSGSNSVCENNQNNTNLWEGAERLGFVPEKIPRNAINCVDCGHCCHGCPYESKQSTQTALFEPLLLDPQYQIEVIPHCTVKRILYEDTTNTTVAAADGTLHPSYKRAIGVEAEVRVFDKNLADMKVADRLKAMENFTGRTRKVLVKAKVVVSAAGSLHTPALLLRSNITHQGMVGQHLTLHPVLGCGGIFPDQETRLASGVSMGVVVRQPVITADFDFSKPNSTRLGANKPVSPPVGDARYAAVLQTPPAHVGLMGLLLPWNGNGLTTKMSMLNWRHSSTFLALVRDQSQARNRVTIDWQGNPVLHYDITNQDKALMLAGLEANLRLMRAAGAKMLYFGHENFPWFFCGKGVTPGAGAAGNAGANNNESRANCTSPTNITRTPFTSTDDERFEAYIRSMRAEGIQTAKMNVFSAHQMSSCRMAPSPATGPTSPSGELYEVSNVFVADGSALPTSLGVNPMVTIEAMAYMVAQNVASRLCEDKVIAQKVRKFQEQKKW
uniref:4Fe-4S ferredoxin-type domain-containing protein n=1 Tax=Spumella elongata TaxID=89044 RepID=A0A7S3HD47_9STRA|mmetsp:Transcript_4667/g.7854  ORF Transcript_4667/g.7854 Transcript_4667/m.7854 type:complete len:934 (+) Transcript_4667:44-2845(+)